MNTRHDICAATGKVRHKTKLAAFGVAEHRNRTHKNRVQGRTEPLHAYRCECCQGFHVGHNVKGKAA